MENTGTTIEVPEKNERAKRAFWILFVAMVLLVLIR